MNSLLTLVILVEQARDELVQWRLTPASREYPDSFYAACDNLLLKASLCYTVVELDMVVLSLDMLIDTGGPLSHKCLPSLDELGVTLDKWRTGPRPN